MSVKKHKKDILKLNLGMLFIEFMIALEKAEVDRKVSRPLEDELRPTFENFTKWVLYEWEKKAKGYKAKK